MELVGRIFCTAIGALFVLLGAGSLAGNRALPPEERAPAYPEAFYLMAAIGVVLLFLGIKP